MKKLMFVAILSVAGTAVFAQDAPKKVVKAQKVAAEDVRLAKRAKLQAVEINQVKVQQSEVQPEKVTIEKSKLAKPVPQQKKANAATISKKRVTEKTVE